MAHFDEPWRAVACAARLRDWAAVDAVLEDLRVQGRFPVMRGFQDAAKQQGDEQTLPRLDKPDPVTIHDLTPEERGRAVIDPGTDGRGRVVASSKFTLKAA